MRLEDAFVLPTYEKFPFALSRGQGCKVWDEAGNEYLDLYGGHAVSLLGHSPAAVAEAIAAQSKELLFYSNLASRAGARRRPRLSSRSAASAARKSSSATAAPRPTRTPCASRAR